MKLFSKPTPLIVETWPHYISGLHKRYLHLCIWDISQHFATTSKEFSKTIRMFLSWKSYSDLHAKRRAEYHLMVFIARTTSSIVTTILSHKWYGQSISSLALLSLPCVTSYSASLYRMAAGCHGCCLEQIALQIFVSLPSFIHENGTLDCTEQSHNACRKCFSTIFWTINASFSTI